VVTVAFSWLFNHIIVQREQRLEGIVETCAAGPQSAAMALRLLKIQTAAGSNDSRSTTFGGKRHNERLPTRIFPGTMAMLDA
jgi:hypothetical protein